MPMYESPMIASVGQISIGSLSGSGGSCNGSGKGTGGGKCSMHGLGTDGGECNGNGL